MTRHDLYPKLGLKPTDHLPPEGMPVRSIDGVLVYVKPQKGSGIIERRVFAICPCGKHVSAFEFFSHHRGECQCSEQSQNQRRQSSPARSAANQKAK